MVAKVKEVGMMKNLEEIAGLISQPLKAMGYKKNRLHHRTEYICEIYGTIAGIGMVSINYLKGKQQRYVLLFH